MSQEIQRIRGGHDRESSEQELDSTLLTFDARTSIDRHDKVEASNFESELIREVIKSIQSTLTFPS
jgi:hypothetical protein